MNVNPEKIIIYNDYLEFYNYKKINKLSKEEIIIDNYTFKGYDLYIKKMDVYVIKIVGNIKDIIFGG